MISESQPNNQCVDLLQSIRTLIESSDDFRERVEHLGAPQTINVVGTSSQSVVYKFVVLESVVK
jgi:hypothetical protein